MSLSFRQAPVRASVAVADDFRSDPRRPGTLSWAGRPHRRRDPGRGSRTTVLFFQANGLPKPAGNDGPLFLFICTRWAFAPPPGLGGIRFAKQRRNAGE